MYQFTPPGRGGSYGLAHAGGTGIGPGPGGTAAGEAGARCVRSRIYPNAAVTLFPPRKEGDELFPVAAAARGSRAAHVRGPPSRRRYAKSFY